MTDRRRGMSERLRRRFCKNGSGFPREMIERSWIVVGEAIVVTVSENGAERL